MRGLQVNFSAGKSEAVVRFAGTGILQAELHLQSLPTEAAAVSGRLVPLLELSDGCSLRFVSAYRHLGGVVSASGSMGEEVAGRCAVGSCGHRGLETFVSSAAEH